MFLRRSQESLYTCGMTECASVHATIFTYDLVVPMVDTYEMDQRESASAPDVFNVKITINLYCSSN